MTMSWDAQWHRKFFGIGTVVRQVAQLQHEDERLGREDSTEHGEEEASPDAGADDKSVSEGVLGTP